MSFNKKIRTTIRLPLSVRQAMHYQIIKDGYNLRGKSIWVSEAIESLLAMANFQEYVEIAHEMSNLTETEVIQISKELKDKIERALILVRKKYPALEGVQSCIIRSSIIQRLLRS